MAKKKKPLVEKLESQPPKRVWTPRPEILLDPPVPVSLSGTAPRVVLGQAWWNKERGAASFKTNWCCIVCEERPRRLEGHERYEVDWLLGTATYLETVPLCPRCHSFIHPGFLRAEVKAGNKTSQEADEIIERGWNILRAAGLKRPDDRIHKGWSSVEWQDWRLVVEGKEYPPLYDSLEDYKRSVKKSNPLGKGWPENK